MVKYLILFGILMVALGAKRNQNQKMEGPINELEMEHFLQFFLEKVYSMTPQFLVMPPTHNDLNDPGPAWLAEFGHNGDLGDIK